MNSNVQYLILPVLLPDYVDEFTYNCNSFKSWVMMGRAICTTLNRNIHIKIFQAFIETENILESKTVTFFSSFIVIIILDLVLIVKIILKCNYHAVV